MSCFSNVDEKKLYDYSVNFSACQKLELLQRKFLKASALLDSITNILRGCKIHHQNLNPDTCNAGWAEDKMVSALDGYAAEVDYYKSRVSTLSQRCSGTANLVSANSKQVKYQNLFILISRWTSS